MEIKRTIDSVHKISTYTRSSTTHTLQWKHCQTQSANIRIFGFNRTEYLNTSEDAHTQRVGEMVERGGRGEVQMHLGVGE